jgi:hypothetical protein
LKKLKPVFSLGFFSLSLFLSAAVASAQSSLTTERTRVVNDSLDYLEEKQEEQPRPTQLIEIQPVSVPPSEDEDLLPPPVSPRISKQRLNPPAKKTSQLKQLHPSESKFRIIDRELDQFDFSMDLGVGVRHDDFKWSIAGDTSGQNPNVLSELTYKDIWTYQIGTQANVLWANHFLLEGSLDYGWVHSGKNQDSDYLADNRGNEFSRSHSDISGDNTFDASLGGGYQFNIHVPEDWQDFLTDDLKIAVLGGYSRHELNLRVTDGVQDIPVNVAFEGLDTTYDTVWKGPWLGFQVDGTRKNFTGFTRFEYHWADYEGSADWNLRDEFQHPTSFIDTADAHGIILAFGGDLAFNDALSFGLNLKVQRWETDPGIDTLYWADGTIENTQYNPAKWTSYGGMLTGTYRFSLGGNHHLQYNQQKEDEELSRL